MSNSDLNRKDIEHLTGTVDEIKEMIKDSNQELFHIKETMHLKADNKEFQDLKEDHIKWKTKFKTTYTIWMFILSMVVGVFSALITKG